MLAKAISQYPPPRGSQGLLSCINLASGRLPWLLAHRRWCLHDKPSFSGARVATKSHDFSYRYVHFNSFKSVKEEKEGRKEGRKKKERKKERNKGRPSFLDKCRAAPALQNNTVLLLLLYCAIVLCTAVQQ